MNIDKTTIRWVIIVLVIAGLAWVEAALHGNHYYRLTYAACSQYDSPYCRDWRSVAIYRSVFVLLVGVAAWLYNERRTSGGAR